MRTIILSFSIFIFSVALSTVKAQDDDKREEVQEEIVELRLEKDDIEREEKEALKAEIEAINKRLEAGKISKAEAEELKELAAEKRALNIQNRTAIVENKIALLERNGELGFSDSEKNYTVGISIFSGDDKEDEDEDKEKEEEIDYDTRTTSDFIIAAGFNNALYEGQDISDSDFKLAGSRFFEIGWAGKTRVFKNTNFLRVKYGVSFVFNGLKPTDNRFFVEQPDGEVELAEYPIALEKSKFRMDNLVFPLHLEFGPSEKTETNEKIRYSTEDKIKIGVGGYAGVGLGSRQKLKYEIDGDDVKQKTKGALDTEDFIYGLSTYIGYGDTSLYAKYDLNPIFENAEEELHNFSLGLRWDF